MFMTFFLHFFCGEMFSAGVSVDLAIATAEAAVDTEAESIPDAVPVETAPAEAEAAPPVGQPSGSSGAA